MTAALDYRWANTRRLNSLPTVEELEAEGYRIVTNHKKWPDSVLMVREVEEGEE